MTTAPKASVVRGIRKRKLLLEHEQEAKKQRVTEVTMVAMDVMNHLLAPTGDVGYDVADEEWERLVQLTQQNEKFQRLFNFPDDAPGWVTTKAKKKKTHLKIVALDCEMCVTASDFTSERFASALCRVSAVNGENILRGIISDFIVHQPEEGMHMVDPKTDIHGITLQQITDSKISLVKAQKKMLKYINKDTIVVGHSVHGDLASMQINHRRVIDTALIFRRNTGDQSRATPGLKDLTKFLLGFEMPTASEIHGPRAERNDERRNLSESLVVGQKEYTGTPMLLPTAFDASKTVIKATAVPIVKPAKTPVNDASYIDLGVITGAADKSVVAPAKKITEVMIARSCRLRVHRIPKGVTSRDIEKFFLQSANIVPSAVEQIVWLKNQNRGSCNVTFATNAHAALAFESSVSSKGKVTKDSIGRPQKAIAVVNDKGTTFKNVTLGIL
ncbi:hypothetical protein BBJ29_000177 [Phytophthora kernoviae]|uniref:Exonuclease domain-containing protein n=1 Tax=Phytophthora kernoviae TaxID=325452 RepID=A0A3F2S3I3_9STRA|nr:hypothetical protein BBJ29_000177 [Phytophthora kernoviae]RLN69517.1 hypothetical protein BBP00_00000352 [Phytophthora kernoviae]